MASYYTSVHDIDLYVGCLNEMHLPDAKMGAIGVCVVADQFSRTKYGDRFFYDRGDQPHSFSLGIK